LMIFFSPGATWLFIAFPGRSIRSFEAVSRE
jgi:hypothetical protein